MANVSHPFHEPVLLSEVLQYLITDREGIYVDGTLGGGGHAEAILKKLQQKARYIAFDQDIDAVEFAKKRLKYFSNIQIHHRNFSEFESILKNLTIDQIDGFFLDLGLSSHQIDETARGFSYMQNTDLDMRMDRTQFMTARELINSLDEATLANIFYQFGEEKRARQIARNIIFHRKKQQITTSDQLKRIIDKVIPRQNAIKSYARIFQSLRIVVNRELEMLEQTLDKSLRYLKNGSRIVIIAYHSLEDRIIKNFYRTKANPCTCPPEFPECICGKKAELRIITRRVVKAGSHEIDQNPRARSARLRVGEKI